MPYALGIDLGTTFTAAAVARNGRVDIVGMGNHTSSIPSAVLLRDDGTLLVGDAAVRRGQQEPARLAKEFKRRLGDAAPIILGHTPYSAERLMAAVLRHVVDTVTERQGEPPSSVVIAHPANWGPYKRELLEGAAALAGVRDPTFVTEPEAAAVHFASGERVDEGGVVAVYDLGGGTFDAAVLRRVGDRFVTMGQPQGIERLGGIDLDEAVMSHVRATLGEPFTDLDPSDPVVRSGMIRLRNDCIAAKEALSDDSEAVIPVLLPGLQTQVRITRPEFEATIRPALRETVTMLQRALEVAGVRPADLSAVVLAGGSSRIPLVAEMVGDALGRAVSVDSHPKDTVALGAARLAASGAHERAAGAAAPVVAAASAASPTPPVAPTPPEPEPVTARQPVTPTAPTQVVPAAATQRRPQPPAPSAPAVASKRGTRWAAIVGVLIVAVAIGVGAVLLLGGDDGGDAAPDGTGAAVQTVDEPTAQTTGAPVVDGGNDGEDGNDGNGGDGQVLTPTTTAAATVTTAGTVTTTVDTAPDTTGAPTSSRPCTAATGRCVFITDIALDGDNVVARYETAGFEAHQNAGPESRHVHFYFDTVPVSQAGIPADSQNWVAWGLEEGGGEPVYTFPVADIPAEATQLCASVANVNHGLDDLNFQCVPLPQA